MRLLIVLLFTFSYVNVRATDLVVGNVADGVVLANHTHIEYRGIPLMKRVKYVFYSSLTNKTIRGIKALLLLNTKERKDLLNTKSSVKVTAGGVGYLFVNLRFMSEPGSSMAYGVGFYVDL